MGFLDELLKTIEEAADEANGRQRPRPQPPAPRPAQPPPAPETPADQNDDIDTIDEDLLRRQQLEAERQRAFKERARAEHAAEEAQQQARRKVLEESRRAQAAAQSVLRRDAQIARAAPPIGAVRIATMLRQQQTLRELVVLREVLDKPLALRRGQRRR